MWMQLTMPKGVVMEYRQVARKSPHRNPSQFAPN